MDKPPQKRLLLVQILLFLLLPLIAAQTLRDPTGFGPCNMCVLLDDPRQLTPCSQAWRDLIAVCSSQTCSEWAPHVSKAPPLSSCTNTPNDLPGGTASAGFSFGTFTSVARSSATATGSAARSSLDGASATSRKGTAGPNETGKSDSGAGRVVAGGLGMGWLWEVVFLAWGAVW